MAVRRAGTNDANTDAVETFQATNADRACAPVYRLYCNVKGCIFSTLCLVKLMDPHHISEIGVCVCGCV